MVKVSILPGEVMMPLTEGMMRYEDVDDDNDNDNDNDSDDVICL